MKTEVQMGNIPEEHLFAQAEDLCKSESKVIYNVSIYYSEFKTLNGEITVPTTVESVSVDHFADAKTLGEHSSDQITIPTPAESVDYDAEVKTLGKYSSDEITIPTVAECVDYYAGNHSSDEITIPIAEESDDISGEH